MDKERRWRGRRRACVRAMEAVERMAAITSAGLSRSHLGERSLCLLRKMGLYLRGWM